MKITRLRIQTNRRQTIWLFEIVTDALNSGLPLRQIQLAVTAGIERGASGSKFQRSTRYTTLPPFTRPVLLIVGSLLVEMFVPDVNVKCK